LISRHTACGAGKLDKIYRTVATPWLIGFTDRVANVAMLANLGHRNELCELQ
jgi:hypothetical protein